MARDSMDQDGKHRRDKQKCESKAVSAPEQVDLAVAQAIEPYADHPATRALGWVGKLGDEPPVMALSAATLAYGLLTRRPRLTRVGARMLAAHGVAIAFKTLGKNTIDRTRPNKTMATGEYRMEPGSSSDKALRSFPSGHAAGAMAVAQAAVREYPGQALPLYGAAGLVAALQVARRAHFVTDVIAGMVTGVTAELVSAGLFHLLAPSVVSRRRGIFSRRS